MKAVNKSIAVLHRPCDPLQRMGFHFAQRDHAVDFQKLFAKNKLFCLNAFLIGSPDAFRKVNGRDAKFLKIRVHSCSGNDFCGISMSAGICQNHSFISLFF